MRYKILTTVFLFINCVKVYSQTFSIARIPESLTKNANAVVQYDRQEIELIDQSKMIIRRKSVISVLNKEADFLGVLSLHYDPFIKIKKVKATFLDERGNEIYRVRKKDFKDFSATDRQTLYSDDRILLYDRTPNQFPYTVVFEYEIHSSYTAFIPHWQPFPSYNVSVIFSGYDFLYPGKFKLQKLEKNLGNYNIKKVSTSNRVSYELHQGEALKYEALSPDFLAIAPYVRLSIDKFFLAGMKGEAGTWNSLGRWMYNKLLAPQNNLSEEVRYHVKELVRGVSDPMERARIVYEYMQQKTRYINIAMGIGGWRPMTTTEVDKLGYGDCKALTLYTLALLDAADVRSYYTIVYAGKDKRDIEKNLVAIQGNHAILCVPVPGKNDTIWLECTNHKLPFGHKNSFTDDRDVFVIYPDGGEVIHTSTYLPEENLLNVEGTFQLSGSGHIEGKVRLIAYGTQYEYFMGDLEGLSIEEQNKVLKKYFGHLDQLQLNQLYINNNKKDKSFEVELSLNSENYATENSDGSILFVPNIINRNTYVPPREIDRKTEFEIPRGFKDTDTYIISLPPQYQIKYLPKDIQLKSKFGFYEMHVEKIEENKIKYHRIIQINSGKYNPEEYDAYRKFRKKIWKSELSKIILKPKN